YIALSHCWGKSTPLVTTTESLADHMRGMPLKDMPKTFREAITITRELGLEFLWIDSLCILQDSKEDWEKESAKMSSVYGNAFLTLSASASEGCEQGIFQPRTVYPGPPVELRCNDSNFEPIYVDYMPENTVFQEPQTTDARAWCFQELALSPRVLVYGKEMLGWLCDSLTDVEHGFVKEHYENINPPLLAPRLNPEPAKNPLENSGSIFSLYHHSRERERSFSRWASMVNAFSRRKLTRESDKLPALSGIAREIHLETGDEYLAGLWRKDLSHHLLWNLDVIFAGKGAEWRRPLSYRAPSWSWAAIEGPIRMDLR
ncbi:HET-domain-containing protein, partial [Thozetella sp. PMI_491]